ncbi:FecR family protein [Hymenobacter psoromatis]|uniref:FecR family protein n=1 Tax=Hymenobacter psoromatis TaxID=1484116 RepID=UPI001CBEC95A|nr:FecR family protein [Hymenobacter psoromatis]
MMTQAEFDAMLQRYLDGQSRPGEQHLVEQWSAQLGRAGYQPLPPPLRAEVRQAMWQRIAVLTADAETTTPVPAVRPLWPAVWREPALRWAAAALLTLGAGALSWWLPRHQPAGTAAQAAPRWEQHTNPSAQPMALRLADGSRVNLYPHSTLRYRTGLTGQRREVYLAGQACFKVTKDPAHPFLVYTDKLVTTVLGTSFMVTAYPNQKNTVAVREGRVAVQRREGAELAATPAHPAATGLLLLPNQQATYSASTKELAKNLVREPVQLTTEPLDFHNRPVAEVLAALEHVYGVSIVYDPAKLRDCTITISFGDESLFEQLDTLCKALDAKYKLANNAQILFESHGCKAS